MKVWMAMATAMLVGVGVPGSDRVVPLPVYAAEQAADQAAGVLTAMRQALGGAKVEQVKGLTLEGPFRREMGQRQVEGTIVLTLQGPDKMHKSEENEFPGGMSVERIQALTGESRRSIASAASGSSREPPMPSRRSRWRTARCSPE